MNQFFCINLQSSRLSKWVSHELPFDNKLQRLTICPLHPLGITKMDFWTAFSPSMKNRSSTATQSIVTIGYHQMSHHRTLQRRGFIQRRLCHLCDGLHPGMSTMSFWVWSNYHSRHLLCTIVEFARCIGQKTARTCQ